MKKIMHKLSKVSLFITSVFCSGIGYAYPNTYTATFLDTPNGLDSIAYDVNEAGQIVGMTYNFNKGSDYAIATLWNGVAATYLNTPAGNMSYASDINNAGQVVGVISQGYGSRAALWNGSTLTYLETPIGSNSQANAINDSGQVVGNIISTPSVPIATMWNSNNTIKPETLSAGSFLPYDINNSGQIVGVEGQNATKWEGNKINSLSAFGQASVANSINNRGQVIGTSYGIQNVATLWNNNIPTYLDTLGIGSSGGDINDVGQAVGSSYMDHSYSTYSLAATLWNDNTPTNLNDFLSQNLKNEGWILSAATAINNKGVIIGYADNKNNGTRRPFVLSPAPEPETYAMMLLGIGLVGIAKRRHNKTGC